MAKRSDTKYTLAGRITNRQDQPLASLTVRAYVRIPSAPTNSLGKEAVTDAEGKYAILFTENDLKIGGVQSGELGVFIRVYDGASMLGESPIKRDLSKTTTIDLRVNPTGNATFQVVGKVASQVSAGVEGLRVCLVDKGIGAEAQLAETVTDVEGAYHFSVSEADLRAHGKVPPDFQIKVYRGNKMLAASEVRYNASNRERLNVLLDDEASSALPSEHEVLTSALYRHFTGKLSDLQETKDRHDITYLANKTGWDARAVTLAVLAAQLSDKSVADGRDTLIEPAFCYALFRAGVPANEAALYQTGAKTVEGIWNQALAQNVLPAALGDHIPTALAHYRKLVIQHTLDNPPLVGVSSLKEMLIFSLGNDADAQDKHKQFIELYVQHQDDRSKFWEILKDDTIFGEAAAKRLKLDGQLAYLTINNLPLIRKLYAESEPNGLTDTLALVKKGYYHADKWQEAIGNGPIPPEISGEDNTEKRSRYAEHLAAQMRLSYPTAVVAQMVKDKKTVLLDDQKNPVAEETMAGVHTWLMAHQKDFEIGRQPIAQYVQQQKLQIQPEVLREITRIQRIYQITPSDTAMNALLKRGLDSAYKVVRYGQDEFVEAFKNDVGNEADARRIYARAQQVHNAVLNIAVSYLTARNAPGIGMSGQARYLNPTPTGPKPSADGSGVIAYPTLENLFGEMDYCSCEHCRSILSPAAYLVDLLMFLDRSDESWKDFTAKWKREHGNAPYPFVDFNVWNAAGKPQNTEITPLQVLLSRRPDIQHLPLTCENTNIPLPYIDVVNETLEYFIAKEQSLDEYRGHNNDGSVSNEELLANPQFVNEAAYTTLAAASFPLPLPFHQPLENLRRYFEKFEAPLPEVMEALRMNDDLERPDPIDPEHPGEYGWRDILMEEVHLSRPEHALLTQREIANNNPHVMLTIKRLYGYDRTKPDDEVMAELSNAKKFTRRVGISYEDLIEILKTRFVNPHSTLIPRLLRLRVASTRLQELMNRQITVAAFNASLAPHLDVTHYAGNIAAWVRNQTNYNNLMSLITLAFPLFPWAPSKRYEKGDCVIPIKPPANSAFYYECTTAGTSALGEPNPWPTISGEICSDHTVEWTCRVGSSDCSFDKLEFRYSDPNKLAEKIRPFEFVRLIRFIRLWKKLGWTIEQTDKMITALYPADRVPNDPDVAVNLRRLDAGFLTMLPRLGIVKRVMKDLKLKPKNDLLPLLACFAPIDTHGEGSLYRQMFPATLRKQAPAFEDDGYGNFLQKVDVPYSHPQATLEQAIRNAASGISYDDSLKRLIYTGVLSIATCNALKAVNGVSAEFQAAVNALFAAQHLSSHAETLRAAFLLTAEEFAQITAALGYDANTPLTMENITAIFRRGWLARKLKLSVREFLSLTQFTDFDPFIIPDPTAPPIVRLIKLVNQLRAASLKPVQALYLIWNQDISGKSAPTEGEISSFARALRSAFTAIESEFALVDDPTGQIARARMALVYGNEATDFFFSLLGNTLVTEVSYSHPPTTLITEVPYKRGPVNLYVEVAYTHGQETLEPAILNAAPGLAYDDVGKLLSFTGKLSQVVLAALKAAAQATLSPQKAMDQFNAAVEKLYVENQMVIQAQLEQPIVNAAAGQIAYDDGRKRLSFSGVLTQATRDALKACAGVKDQFKGAVDSLYAENQKIIQAHLEQPIVNAAPGRIAYNDFRKRLSFTGELTVSDRDALKAAATATLSSQNAAKFNAAVEELYEENGNVLRRFFERYPELRPLYEAFTFFGSLVSSVIYKHDQSTLTPAIVNAASGRIAYDDAFERLSFKGILTEATRGKLTNPVVATPKFRGAVDNIYEENQKAINDFFNLHPKLDTQKRVYLAANDSEEKRRLVLLANFLPELKRRRKQQQALQLISAAAKTDADFPGAVLDNKIAGKYALHALRGVNRPALDDLLALEGPGLSAQFFFKDTATGEVNSSSAAEPNLAYASKGSTRLPANPDAGKTISAIWSGCLAAPENGFYNFQIEADAGAKVTLSLDSAEVALAQNGNIWNNDAPIELSAGTLHPISFKVENVKDTLKISWQSEGRGWEVIPAPYLYSAILLDDLQHAYVRFLKAVSLAGVLKLTAAETSYLATHADYQIGGQHWLNWLPITGSLNKNISKPLGNALSALLDFSLIKAELAPDDERLLAVFKDPMAASPNQDSLLFALTRWDSDSLNALLTRFGKTVADLAHLTTFCRVYDAYAWVKKLGVPATTLIKSATNEPNAAAVRDLQASLRARHDESEWLNVIKPINDEMRGLQRDALVAHILHQMRSNSALMHIDTPEKLFEYFLMDVQMEPCMKTSRIRHALSSVQLFIERCLMNLEPQVVPSLISTKQWEWMKRYRVWEANRKVFLYPENWLEPELRDDQSPFFKETMSELLQSDITEDRATTALLNYLSKLDEVAKLEPCGIHYIEDDPTADDQHEEVAHVVARTAGANRKYYYRRRDSFGWTPWEQIKLDIEDNPVIPVVWKGRLLLFWLRILKQAPLDPPEPSSQGLTDDHGVEKSLDKVTVSAIKNNAKDEAKNMKINVQAVLCWSEYYNGKWQPTKTSDLNQPAALGSVNADGDGSFERSVLCLTALPVSVVLNQGIYALMISISGQGGGSFKLFNTHSRPESRDGITAYPYLPRSLEVSGDIFMITYCKQRQITIDSEVPDFVLLPRSILKNSFRDRVVFPSHELQNPWDAPFFYEDGHHVFYVTTTNKLVTFVMSDTYGFSVLPQAANSKILPIIHRKQPHDGRSTPFSNWDGPIIGTIGYGITALSHMERFVTEDAYIHRGIVMPGTIRFGDTEIGPAGSLIFRNRKDE